MGTTLGHYAPPPKRWQGRGLGRTTPQLQEVCHAFDGRLPTLDYSPVRCGGRRQHGTPPRALLFCLAIKSSFAERKNVLSRSERRHVFSRSALAGGAVTGAYGARKTGP